MADDPILDDRGAGGLHPAAQGRGNRIRGCAADRLSGQRRADGAGRRQAGVRRGGRLTSLPAP